MSGVGTCRATAAASSRISGVSGDVSWEIVDLIQTRLPEERALRWDYVVVLTSVRAIRFNRFVVGGSDVSNKFEHHLAANGEVRVHHWDRTPSGTNSLVARRRYYGTDDAGNQLGIEVRFNLNPTIGTRDGAASVRVASPTARVPLPWDAGIVAPAASVPRDLAALSGLWIGRWDGVRDHVLLVEEVGDRHALVSYAWGTSPTVPQPGWIRARGEFRQGRLTIDFFEGATVTYEAEPDGRLLGVYTRGNLMAVARLTRQPGGSTAAVAAVAPPAARAGSLAREAWQELLDGRYADALPKAQQALALREELFGSEHLEVAASLNVLGEVYRAQGRFDDAERVHRRALAIRERHLGPGDPNVATTLNNLAMLHNARAVYVEAEALLKRALEIVERARGTALQNRALEAEVLENLAKVYRALGRTAEAQEAQARAMMLWTMQ
jgi:Flp pilus assembly protein TadD